MGRLGRWITRTFKKVVGGAARFNKKCIDATLKLPIVGPITKKIPIFKPIAEGRAKLDEKISNWANSN